MIRKAGADEAFLRLEAYKAMVEVSNGQATKLIIPSEMQGMVGLASSLAEAVKKDEPFRSTTRLYQSDRGDIGRFNLSIYVFFHCHEP